MTPFVTQQGLDVAVQTLQKRIDAVNESVVTTNHNTLSGLQGGQSGQYYHLTAAAYGYLSAQDQYVKTTSAVAFTGVAVTKNSTMGDETSGGISILSEAAEAKLILGAVSGSHCYIQAMQNGTGWTTRPLILQGQGGNVGIGTVSPPAKLTVVGSTISGAGEPTYPGTIRIETAGGDYNQIGGLEFIAARSGDGYGWRISNPDLGTGECPLYIMTRNAAAAWTKRLSILQNGNVGIGVTSPSYPLDVLGDICVSSVYRIAGVAAVNQAVTTTSDPTFYGVNLTRPASLLDSPFGQRKIYNSTMNNALHDAGSRFNVTIDGGAPLNNTLFNGNYDQNGWAIPFGTTQTMTIDLTANGEFDSNGLVYAYGYLLVHFYYTCHPTVATLVRVRLYTSNGGSFAWRDWVTGVNFANDGGSMIAACNMQSNYFCTKVQIEITSDSTGYGNYCWVAQIEWPQDRGVGDISNAYMRKGAANNLYNTLTWKDGTNTTKASITTAGVGTFVNLISTGLTVQSDGGYVYIKGTTDYYSMLYFNSGAGAGTNRWRIGLAGDSVNFVIYDVVNSLNRLCVSTSGQVGIGKITPASQLHLVDAINRAPSLTTDAVAAVIFENAGPQLAFGCDGASPYENWIQSRYWNSAWNLSINPLGGRVGIGTADPGYILDTYAASGNSFIRSNRLDNTVYGGFLLATGGTNKWSIQLRTGDENFYIHDEVYGISALTILPNSGNVGIGQSTFGTSAAKVLAIGTGTPPSTSPADAIQFYSSDFAAGNACPYFRTENGTVIGLNQSLLTTDGPSFDHVHLTVAIGTAPLVVTSTTVVTNLNADLWDGYQFSDYLDQAVKIASSPTHAGLTIGTLAGLLKGTAGVVGAIAFDAVATHYLNGQGDWSIPSGTDPGGLGIYAAATIAVHNDTEKTTTSTTYVKVKEMKINEAWAGSWRLVFSITADGTHLAYGKVYVNSVAKGAEHSTALSDPTPFSDDITLNLAINDLIQIYAKRATGGTCAISSMMFEYAWHLTTIGAHTLTTPLNVTDTTVISFTNQDP